MSAAIAGNSWLRSNFESRDSANEAAAQGSAADKDSRKQPQAAQAPVSSPFAGSGVGQSSAPAKAAAPRKEAGMPFRSAFATEDSEEALPILSGVPQPQSAQRPPVPCASAAEAPGRDASASACAPGQQRPRRRPIPSAFAAEEPDEAGTGSGDAPEALRQQRAPPVPSAFAQSDSPADTSYRSPNEAPRGTSPAGNGRGAADGEHAHRSSPGPEQEAESSQPAKAKGVIPLIKSAFQSEN